jgi:glycosyltransferase involved in cell wall biosynthesis
LSSFITTPLLTLLQSWTLRRSAALVAYSERTAALYRHFSGSTRMTVIPPGVDTEEFAPPDEQNPDRKAAPEGRPIRVIAVGYLVRRKAFDVIITAIARLVGMRLPVELRIVGEGPARPALERLARHLGVERYIRFAGLVPHDAIAREYHAADIFCSMSLSESFSIVGQEAMACGLPVVATPTGFFGEALRNHRAGTLVRFGDADGLAAAVAELVASRHLREALGREARQLMVREFDWSVIARSYLSLYCQLASPTG